jgi:hypothetical protein
VICPVLTVDRRVAPDAKGAPDHAALTAATLAGSAAPGRRTCRWASCLGDERRWNYETPHELREAGMVTMNVSAAREQLADAIERATHEAVVIERSDLQQS